MSLPKVATRAKGPQRVRTVGNARLLVLSSVDATMAT